ncbi:MULTISPECIES: ATP-binding protein [unclassified Coleofasciculus]|uniref:hybrid sensor histidine kinase/response regulator n=1 Tax=unclassified Coleofasciculus TaxID=2692782 RepID=UPI0018800CE2|nr:MULTISPECIES: ATP-binding protein [unclassified Coleofasciculus]MBE9126817.1 response regulator [Coleofasciculus sp. LEGE 07081]MBE9150188.1 response regulator [Coleofasciculus sp. LEGE 07092]
MYKTPICILLVEDSPSDAMLLCQIFYRLGKDGWNLVHVERLSDAIDIGNSDSIDAVLLDLSLPDSDGLETVAEFHTSLPEIPIVVLTGFDDEDFALEAVAIGAQDYLVKGQITDQLLFRTLRYAIERGQILKQLQESERRFRGIFEQTFQSMRLLSPEGNVLEINQTALDFCGSKQEDIVGRPLWELKSWNYSQATQDWLKTATANARQEQFVRGEVQMRGAGDGMVWVDFSLKPLKDETGKVIMLIAEGRDISDRKRAEAEIVKALQQEQELNELKTSFLSMVSHEFRTPMTIIQFSAELIEKYNQKLTEEKKSKYFERIQSSIKNVLQLLDEVLLLGRAESGKLQYQPTPLNLKEFCDELTETLTFNASSQHNITLTYQGDATQVEMDEFLLQHILANLLSNAIKYSPEGGNIGFNITCQNGTATFQIKDEGIGIPLKDQNRLFETFERSSNVGQIKGTGLGLSIVKRCVDLHKGQIEVESGEGVGTTFKVMLPLFSQLP